MTCRFSRVEISSRQVLLRLFVIQKAKHYNKSHHQNLTNETLSENLNFKLNIQTLKGFSGTYKLLKIIQIVSNESMVLTH